MAAAASADYAELKAGHGGVLWVEYRPDTGRCSLWFGGSGESRCLTPDDHSIRSRVYEYGGGAFCVTEDGVAFVGEADQQIYLQSIDGHPPRLLSNNETARHGDLQYDARANAIVCVEEQPGEPERHRLVSIDIHTGARAVIAETADFYASPCISPRGDRLAWIEWDRPEQPWTSTRLCVSSRDDAGRWSRLKVVAGTGGNEALQQPRFDSAGGLHALSDVDGWWRPWREQGDRWAIADTSVAADHASAPWQLGSASYLPMGDGYVACRLTKGFGELVVYQERNERTLAQAYTRFRSVAMDADHLYVIAAAPHCGSAILSISPASGDITVLSGGCQLVDDDQLSRPEPFEYPVAGTHAHGFLYRPRNAGATAPDTERPPLVLFLHGGPTSACYPVFDPRIQFWTQRGFAVADLNYRGSSGFGRDYRFGLKHHWGVSDVEDAVAAVDHLAAKGIVDGERAFIRGGSAGGYTALCALAFSDRFQAGASLYGVSDPLALARATHKFEGDYLDWLIGDPDLDLDRYRARTPLLHADSISSPVIFFQGGRDAVVVPAQTESMVDALRQKGIKVEYHFYPEERHGFRQAENLADVMVKELAFYQQCL
jgi:dipeptidyl aminopeptidase/acylaminoacyl peptidase